MAKICPSSRIYRDYLGLNIRIIKAPEIQQMYSLNMPVSQLRTKVRQEFERHRYVQQLPVVDMLLFQSHAEFQVRTPSAVRKEAEAAFNDHRTPMERSISIP